MPVPDRSSEPVRIAVLGHDLEREVREELLGADHRQRERGVLDRSAATGTRCPGCDRSARISIRRARSARTGTRSPSSAAISIVPNLMLLNSRSCCASRFAVVSLLEEVEQRFLDDARGGPQCRLVGGLLVGPGDRRCGDVRRCRCSSQAFADEALQRFVAAERGLQLVGCAAGRGLQPASASMLAVEVLEVAGAESAWSSAVPPRRSAAIVRSVSSSLPSPAPAPLPSSSEMLVLT